MIIQLQFSPTSLKAIESMCVCVSAAESIANHDDELWFSMQNIMLLFLLLLSFLDENHVDLFYIYIMDCGKKNSVVRLH